MGQEAAPGVGGVAALVLPPLCLWLYLKLVPEGGLRTSRPPRHLTADLGVVPGGPRHPALPARVVRVHGQPGCAGGGCRCLTQAVGLVPFSSRAD